MHSLPQEFLALCRHLGDVQKRCSATVAAQAAQIEALQAQVLRLRAEVIVRDTRLAMAQDVLAQWKAAHPSLPRRKAMARHISMLAERIASLSRECLRWRVAAEAAAAKNKGLGLVVGLNVINGGNGSSGIRGDRSGEWSMSASEIRNYGYAMLGEGLLTEDTP